MHTTDVLDKNTTTDQVEVSAHTATVQCADSISLTCLCEIFFMHLTLNLAGQNLNFYIWISSRYSRSDCSAVRTRTVIWVESDWPLVSVTVSWNLYTPDVRLDTMTWSSKLVFYNTPKDNALLWATSLLTPQEHIIDKREYMNLLALQCLYSPQCVQKYFQTTCSTGRTQSHGRLCSRCRSVSRCPEAESPGPGLRWPPVDGPLYLEGRHQFNVHHIYTQSTGKWQTCQERGSF